MSTYLAVSKASWQLWLALYGRSLLRWGWFVVLSVILTTICSSLIPDIPLADGYLATLRVQVQLPKELNDTTDLNTTIMFFSRLFVSPGTLSLTLSKHHDLQLSDLEALVTATPVTTINGALKQTDLLAPVSPPVTTSPVTSQPLSAMADTTNVVLLNALGDTPHDAAVLVTDIYQAFLQKVHTERSLVVDGLKAVLIAELKQSEVDLAHSTAALQTLSATGAEFSSQYRFLDSLYSTQQNRLRTINTLLVTLRQQGIGRNDLLELSNDTPDIRTVPGAELTQSQRLALSPLEHERPTHIDAAELTQGQRLALSPLVGLIMGLGGVLLASRFSNTLPLRGKRRAMVLPHITEVVPVLPKLHSNRLQVLQKASSPSLQVLGHLRYQASEHEQRLQLITITSPKGREGKSTLATSLALAAAQSGQRTFLVDANPRKPVLHMWFKLPNTYGTLDTIRSLAGDTLDPSPIHVTPIMKLGLVSIGNTDPKESSDTLKEPLRVDGLKPFTELLRSQADLVIFDGPSLLTDAGATNLVMLSDVALLVVDAQKSQSTTVLEASALLSEMGVSFATVLNRARSEAVE